MSLQEFREAATESIRVDWVVFSANMIGVCVVLLAALHARIDNPVLEATVHASVF